MAEFDRERVEAKILETIKEFAADPSAVTLDATLEDLDMGSLDVVEIAQVLEDEFDVEILGQEREDGPPPQAMTVGDVIEDLAKHVERAGVLAGG
jgi:acyl carrier protein